MGLLRGIVGFLTFLLAFDLKGGGNDAPVPIGLSIGRAVRHAAGFEDVGTGHPATAPTWHFGAVLVASVAGALLGALIAPRLRQIVSEERILVSALLATAAVAVGCALQGGLLGSAALALMVGVGASAGRLVVRFHRATRRARTRTTAVPSRASRPDSSSCGSSAASCR